MVKCKCTNCGYEWNYKGKYPDYAYITCPMCYSKIKLNKAIDNTPESTPTDKGESLNGSAQEEQIEGNRGENTCSPKTPHSKFRSKV